MPDLTSLDDNWSLLNEHTFVSTALGHRYPTVLVEGADDVRLYRTLLSERLPVQVFRAYSQSSELMPNKVLKDCAQCGRTNIVVIQDADLAWAQGKKPPAQTVWTDATDLETTILSSSEEAVKKIVAEYQLTFPVGWQVPEDIASQAKALRRWVFDTYLPIGRLRLRMQGAQWCVSMEDLPYQQWLQADTWALCVRPRLVEWVADKLRQRAQAIHSCYPSEEQLFEIATTPCCDNEKPQYLCRGHDLTTLLAIYSLVMGAKREAQQPSALKAIRIGGRRKNIEAILRSAFGRADFHRTRMHCRLWHLHHQSKLPLMDSCGAPCWVRQPSTRWCEKTPL